MEDNKRRLERLERLEPHLVTIDRNTKINIYNIQNPFLGFLAFQNPRLLYHLLLESRSLRSKSTKPFFAFQIHKAVLCVPNQSPSVPIGEDKGGEGKRFKSDNPLYNQK